MLTIISALKKIILIEAFQGLLMVIDPLMVDPLSYLTPFVYGYMASDPWQSTTQRGNPLLPLHWLLSLINGKCSHKQDSTYRELCYTSRWALAGTRSSSLGDPSDDSTTELHLSSWCNKGRGMYYPACLMVHIMYYPIYGIAHIKYPLPANGRVSHEVVAAGRLYRYPSGPLTYAQCHITKR